MKPTHGQEGIKQLDGYLACKVDDKEILKSFPAIWKLSLKVNTAFPASAACERLFSTAGLFFSPRRARMDFENHNKVKKKGQIWFQVDFKRAPNLASC